MGPDRRDLPGALVPGQRIEKLRILPIGVGHIVGHDEIAEHAIDEPAGFLGRQTFVIGADGNVKKIYRKVDVSKHASEVLADVKS